MRRCLWRGGARRMPLSRFICNPPKRNGHYRITPPFGYVEWEQRGSRRKFVAPESEVPSFKDMLHACDPRANPERHEKRIAIAMALDARARRDNVLCTTQDDIMELLNTGCVRLCWYARPNGPFLLVNTVQPSVKVESTDHVGRVWHHMTSFAIVAQGYHVLLTHGASLEIFLLDKSGTPFGMHWPTHDDV